MKLSVAIILLALSALAAKADDRSAELLGKMSAAIGGWASYRVEFSVVAEQGAMPVSGDYTVSGRSYRMKAGGSEVFGDGKVRYQVDHANREVTVDAVDPADDGVLADPARAFEFPDSHFTHANSGQKTIDGRTCSLITLTPRDAGSALRSVTLAVDPATGLPAQLDYTLDGVSRPVEVSIVRIAPVTSGGDVKFDRGRYKGYEVIDFR